MTAVSRADAVWEGDLTSGNGRVKVAVNLAKGKKDYDKRETIKRRETDRETRAAIKERRR